MFGAQNSYLPRVTWRVNPALVVKETTGLDPDDPDVELSSSEHQ